MIGWLRALVLTLLFALLGAAAGRMVAEQRRRAEAGEAGRSSLDTAFELPKPQELVPGLVAALRVGDRPWSFLRIPPWGAAFVVNFVVAVMGRELQPRSSEPSGDPAGFGFAEPPARPQPPTVETVEVNGHAEEAIAGTGQRTRPPGEGFVPFED